MPALDKRVLFTTRTKPSDLNCIGDFEKYVEIEKFGVKEWDKGRYLSTLQRIGHYCKPRQRAAIAPAVERTLGKGEVACSNHAGSTILSTFMSI